MTKHYIETNPTLELPDKINDGLELSKVVFVILSPDNRMDVSRYDYANKRWFSSKQPLWWLKEVEVKQVSEEWLEQKIKGCDELGGMEKEKWAFQQCLKFVKSQPSEPITEGEIDKAWRDNRNTSTPHSRVSGVMTHNQFRVALEKLKR